jgi:hypothetical protein
VQFRQPDLPTRVQFHLCKNHGAGTVPGANQVALQYWAASVIRGRRHVMGTINSLAPGQGLAIVSLPL